MFKTPRYLSNSFAINFERAPRIRREANKFEDALAGHYGQPQVLPIPDELDANVPRMVFSSTHGFSQVIISQVSISIAVQYSPDWQTDVERGRHYLKDRVELIFGIVEEFEWLRFHYAGLTTRVQLEAAASDVELLQMFEAAFLTKNVQRPLFGVAIKFISIIDDKYFSNITIDNYRTWATPQPGDGRLPAAAATARGVGVLGDFNDRYAFNERRDYVTSRNSSKDIVDKGLDETANVVRMIQGLV